jgi:hypothetical protein
LLGACFVQGVFFARRLRQYVPCPAPYVETLVPDVVLPRSPSQPLLFSRAIIVFFQVMRRLAALASPKTLPRWSVVQF